MKPVEKSVKKLVKSVELFQQELAGDVSSEAQTLLAKVQKTLKALNKVNSVKATKTTAKKVSKKAVKEGKKAVKVVKKASKPITVQRSDEKDPTVMEDTTEVAPPVSPVVNDGVVMMVPIDDTSK